MPEMELLIEIILNILIALGLLSVYESQQKNGKPTPTIIELFIISVSILFFAFLKIKFWAYLFAIIFAIFFLFLFVNKYVESINKGRVDEKDKGTIATIKWRIKGLMRYETFLCSVIIVLFLTEIILLKKITNP